MTKAQLIEAGENREWATQQRLTSLRLVQNERDPERYDPVAWFRRPFAKIKPTPRLDCQAERRRRTRKATAARWRKN